MTPSISTRNSPKLLGLSVRAVTSMVPAAGDGTSIKTAAPAVEARASISAVPRTNVRIVSCIRPTSPSRVVRRCPSCKNCALDFDSRRRPFRSPRNACVGEMLIGVAENGAYDEDTNTPSKTKTLQRDVRLFSAKSDSSVCDVVTARSAARSGGDPRHACGEWNREQRRIDAQDGSEGGEPRRGESQRHDRQRARDGSDQP